MDINTFYNEYENLSDARKREGLQNIFNFLLKDLEYNHDHIIDMLDAYIYLEQEDYFGTEGLDI